MSSFIHTRAAIYNNHIPCDVFILFGALPANWIESERGSRELENSKWNGGKLGSIELVNILLFSYFLFE